jgi:hypothetical protein
MIKIIIGIIVELLSLIPSLLLVELFRRLRSREKQISPLHRALYKIRSSIKMSTESSINVDKKKTEKRGMTLPWWFIYYITYGLCVILIFISIIFIIARGIEFGDLKTQKWLISILSGFFSSILVTQPIKVKFCLIYLS